MTEWSGVERRKSQQAIPGTAERRRPVLLRIIQEGIVSGVIGALAVAVWFLIVDTIAGRPFFTPSMLGAATFHGVRDPALVQITVENVAGYSFLHFLLFVAIGIGAAALAAIVDRFPTTLFLVIVFFAVFEVGFYVVMLIVARPLLGALTWPNIAFGNLIAAGGMGWYLWNAHPHIRVELQEHPLGETVDAHGEEHPAGPTA